MTHGATTRWGQLIVHGFGATGGDGEVTRVLLACYGGPIGAVATAVRPSVTIDANTNSSTTTRRVVGFMSGNQQDPDMICEVFVLAPTDLVDGHEVPDF